jgi:hypothetical protein
LTVNPIADGDNNLSADEQAVYQNIAITGQMNGNFYSNGAFNVSNRITVTANGNTYTGFANPDGTFSVSVPTSALVNDPDKTIEIRMFEINDTTVAATVTRTYTVEVEQGSGG